MPSTRSDIASACGCSNCQALFGHTLPPLIVPESPQELDLTERRAGLSNIVVNNHVRADMEYPIRWLRAEYDLGSLEVVITGSGDPGYSDIVRGAFNFLRRWADGRYSSSTLMRLLDAADAPEGRVLPAVISIGSPYEYDEETETKTGGPVGTFVHLNDEQGRCLVAVHPEFRRKKVGTALHRLGAALTHHVGADGRPTVPAPMSYWVAATNTIGQLWLLSNDCMPRQMNSSGALRYVRAGSGEYEGDL